MVSVKKPKQGLKQFHIDVISSKKLKHVTLLLPIKLDKIMVPHFTGFWPKSPQKTFCRNLFYQIIDLYAVVTSCQKSHPTSINFLHTQRSLFNCKPQKSLTFDNT